MLINVEEEFYTPLYRHLLLSSEESSIDLKSFLSRSYNRLNPRFTATQYPGVIQNTSVSVSLSSSPKYKINDMPTVIIDTWDKRNRHFKKVIHSVNRKFYQTDWSDIEKMSEQELNKLRSKHNTMDEVITYGVADNIEQICKHYKFLENHPDNFTIFFSEIHKSHQPECGGWRWHKWGPYLGTQKPTMEYLYDEKEIDKVIIFSITKVEVKKPVYSTDDFDLYEESKQTYHILNKQGELVCPLFLKREDNRYYVGPFRKAIHSYPQGIEVDEIFKDLLQAQKDFEEGKKITFTDWKN